MISVSGGKIYRSFYCDSCLNKKEKPEEKKKLPERNTHFENDGMGKKKSEYSGTAKLLAGDY